MCACYCHRIEELKSNVNVPVMVLVGNKTDLSSQREVTFEEAEAFADRCWGWRGGGWRAGGLGGKLGVGWRGAYVMCACSGRVCSEYCGAKHMNACMHACMHVIL